MRFEAKNQDHKRAAKMGNFMNVPKTVATFWAERSAHRARMNMKKRKRDEPTMSPAGVLSYQGMDLARNVWILFESDDCSLRLATIHKISWTQKYGHILYVTAFDPAAILQADGEGGEYAESSSLDCESGEELRVVLSGIGATVVVPVKYGGKVWFIEQP